MVTKEEWDALDKKVTAFEKLKARKADNQAIIDRIKGVPANLSDDNDDPQNPNVK